MSRQKNTEVITRASVTIASDQAPIKPIVINDASEAIPILGPASCQAMRNRISSINGAGVETSVVSKEVNMKSMGTRIA